MKVLFSAAALAVFLAGPASAASFDLQSLQTATTADISVALADAQAHNDAPAVQCYSGVLAYVQAHPLSAPSVNVVGVVSAFQVGRDGVKFAEAAKANGIVPDAINQACGYLALDVQKDVANAGFSIFGVQLF